MRIYYTARRNSKRQMTVFSPSNLRYVYEISGGWPAVHVRGIVDDFCTWGLVFTLYNHGCELGPPDNYSIRLICSKPVSIIGWNSDPGGFCNSFNAISSHQTVQQFWIGSYVRGILFSGITRNLFRLIHEDASCWISNAFGKSSLS